MVQFFVKSFTNNASSLTLFSHNYQNISHLYQEISSLINIPLSYFYLTTQGGKLLSNCHNNNNNNDISFIHDGMTLLIKLKILGGIDFQHREGVKFGRGQTSESQAAIERKERLRKLALETIDITKDPYILRNHLGTYECKLCLTLHNNEGNYLAHTQGKRHQVRISFYSSYTYCYCYSLF